MQCRRHNAFGTPEKRDRLIQTLKAYSDRLNSKYPEEECIIQEDFRPPRRLWTESPYFICEIASSLYQAFSKRMACTCTEIHEYAARIAVATYRGRKDKGQKFDFDLNLCLDFPRGCWQETHVSASLAQ